MRSDIRISVIVPVLNEESTVDACVESLLNLNSPKENLEIIVVDNGSTDRSIELLRRHAHDITLLHEEKRGPGAARNKGIVNSTGDVIAFTDADCIVDREWLSNLTRPLMNSRIGIAGGRILAHRPSNQIERFGEQIHDHRRAIEECNPPYAITMNWASPRSVLNAVGLFREEFIRGEDSDLSRRIVQAGYDLIYVPGAFVYHRNERTFASLFRQGYWHGLYGVLIRRSHRSMLPRGGAGSAFIVKKVAIDFTECFVKPNRFEALCWLVFDLGKATGTLAGSFKF